MFSRSLTNKAISRQMLPIVSYLFLIAIITGCFAEGKEKNTAIPAAAAVNTIPVDGNIIKPATLQEELEITGSLAANQQVDIVSELTRKIIRVNVKEGAYVQAGQLLFDRFNLPFELVAEPTIVAIEEGDVTSGSGLDGTVSGYRGTTVPLDL